MLYKNVQLITKQIAEEIFSSTDIESICNTLVAIAFHEQDWRWAQDICLRFLENTEPQISGLAATCLGHIARVHRQLDKEKVIKMLQQHLSNQQIAGRVGDALDDIEMFI